MHNGTNGGFSGLKIPAVLAIRTSLQPTTFTPESQSRSPSAFEALANILRAQEEHQINLA